MAHATGTMIEIPQVALAAFCRKWKVAELSLFGSAARGEARPDSDVDVLVRFEDGMPWDLLDWVDMIDELKSIFGRNVDLVDADSLRNPFRRAAILADKLAVYASR